MKAQEQGNEKGKCWRKPEAGGSGSETQEKDDARSGGPCLGSTGCGPGPEPQTHLVQCPPGCCNSPRDRSCSARRALFSHASWNGVFPFFTKESDPAPRAVTAVTHAQGQPAGRVRLQKETLSCFGSPSGTELGRTWDSDITAGGSEETQRGGEEKPPRHVSFLFSAFSFPSRLLPSTSLLLILLLKARWTFPSVFKLKCHPSRLLSFFALVACLSLELSPLPSF